MLKMFLLVLFQNSKCKISVIKRKLNDKPWLVPAEYPWDGQGGDSPDHVSPQQAEGRGHDIWRGRYQVLLGMDDFCHFTGLCFYQNFFNPMHVLDENSQ